jgi:hypothetical protein
VVIGGREAGEALVDDPRVALISATGSTRMGREVAPKIAARFARSILELGGNNAMILGPSADLDMAVRAILFSAVGTAGQRCTSLRRLIAHESVKEEIVTRLKAAYSKVRIGHPLEGNLVGPLIDKHSFENMQDALEQALSEGGRVFGGERQLAGQYPHAYYVAPAIVEMPEQSEVVCSETFAPILYVVGYSDFAEALRLNNAVPQGLSSCIFTTDVREAEQFMSATGSDCGIANVNIGPSGAEIGGAFGGEKETGGGRESGSDAWRGYMRRQTNTVNYSLELPLAQGITFDLPPSPQETLALTPTVLFLRERARVRAFDSGWVSGLELGNAFTRTMSVGNPHPQRPQAPAFKGELSVDVCVIGAGITGLSAAIHLLEQGKSVCVLEAHRTGHGGSGRNVGLVNAGMWIPPDDIEAGFGEAVGSQLNRMLGRRAGAGIQPVDKYRIDCQLRREGTLHMAHNAGRSRSAQPRAAMERRGAPVELLTGAGVRSRHRHLENRRGLARPPRRHTQPHGLHLGAGQGRQ